MGKRNNEFDHGRRKRGSVVSQIKQPVSFMNKFPAICDTCGVKKEAGQVKLSADPGDKRWTGKCLDCEADTNGSLFGDWETPAEGGDIDRDYHGQ